MELSVVVSTLNGRERLLDCLDSVTASVPAGTELVVVNGPSSDGTTGAVRGRTDVDVLVEISERNRNVSRNAGFEVASGDAVAFLGDECVVDEEWYAAVERSMADGADIVTGPVSGTGRPANRKRTIAGRSIPALEGENVAFGRTVLEALDGFDEYLDSGGATDCAHRLAGLGFDVHWSQDMLVRRELTDGGRDDPDWGDTYRSRAYRLGKNYGLRPTVIAQIFGSALRDGVRGGRDIATGASTPTGWFDNGVAVTKNLATGLADGIRARYADRTARRNPNGVTVRHDRAVRVYDRRE